MVGSIPPPLPINGKLKKENKMSNCEVVADAPTAYNDERFKMIQNKARKLKGLAREINEMANHKFNDLLGAPPPEVNLGSPPDQCKPCSWVDKVLQEQDAATMILEDVIARISMV